MSPKPIRARRSCEQLAMRTGKGEDLDYVQAETLRSTEGRCLLPFSYERGRHGATLSYDLANTMPLETFLAAEISLAQFKSMLEDVLEVFGTCGELGLDPTRIDFDPGSVRLSATDNHLAFAYLPVHGLREDRATAKALLMHVALQARFVCEENHGAAERLADYLERQTVFSAVDFRKFLGADGLGETGRPGQVTAASARASTSRPAFDFVSAQAGAQSAREVRASQTLAEQIAADVASAPLLADSGTLLEPPAPAAVDVAQPFFIVRLADGARFRIEPGGEITVGRLKRCGIRMPDNLGLSREHARICANRDTCTIEDLGSTNGTRTEAGKLAPHVPTALPRNTAFWLANEAFRLE